MDLKDFAAAREAAALSVADVAAARRAVRDCGGAVTVGDVMAGAGLRDVAAEAALRALLVQHPATLEVRDDGTLVYRFDSTSLARRRVERALDATRRFIGGTLLTVAKIGIMATLVGYSLFFIVIAIVAAVAAIFATEGDVPGGEGALELLALPFRLLVEALFWAPDWLAWGTTAEFTPRKRHRDRTPAYDRVFRYLFGPPAPRLRETQRLRDRAALIRERRGVLTIVDLMLHTGTPKAEAEREMAMLVGQLGGDIVVSDDGAVLYLFPELVASLRGTKAAAPTTGKPRTAQRAARQRGAYGTVGAAPYEGQRPLTGNGAGTNAAIAGLATLTLVGGLVGGKLFAMLGHFGTLPMLVGVVPAFIGAAFLVVPPLRYLFLRRENVQRAERDMRRALLEANTEAARPRTMASWVRELSGKASLTRPRQHLATTMVRDVGAEFGVDIEADNDRLLYRFPALQRLFAAGRREREARKLEHPRPDTVTFTTAEPTC